MIDKNIRSFYERKVDGRTITFLEHSSFLNKTTGDNTLKGLVLDRDHLIKVDMNYDKMISRGWRKVDHPLLTLRNTMRSDIAKLRSSDPLGLVPEIPAMIAYYADKLDDTIYTHLITRRINDDMQSRI